MFINDTKMQPDIFSTKFPFQISSQYKGFLFKSTNQIGHNQPWWSLLTASLDLEALAAARTW